MILSYIFLAVYSLVVLIPFYVIISTSFISLQEQMLTTQFKWFPDEWVLDAYVTVLVNDTTAVNGVSSILRGFFNTIWMSVPTAVIGLFVSGLAAYAHAKLQFRAKNVLFSITLATMMVPSAVLTLPSYLYYDAIGWSNGPLPLIIPGMFGGASMVFFMRQFFAGIPTDLIEAGKLDDMGYFKMYVTIMVPLSVPAFLAQGIFAFVSSYNNYMGPLLYLSLKRDLWTLQLALGLIQSQYSYNKAVQCASAVVALVPIVIVYLVCQRFFIQGVAAAGMKE